MKATTLDTCLNNELVAPGAIQANRLQKSSNIRYTLVNVRYIPQRHVCQVGALDRASSQNRY